MAYRRRSVKPSEYMRERATELPGYLLEDAIQVLGSASITSVFNRVQGKTRSIPWAIGELFLGGFIAVFLGDVPEGRMLKNISMGVSTAGMIQIISLFIPEKE